MLEMYGGHDNVLFHAVSVIVYGVPEDGANCGVARSRPDRLWSEDWCVLQIWTL